MLLFILKYFFQIRHCLPRWKRPKIDFFWYILNFTSTFVHSWGKNFRASTPLTFTQMEMAKNRFFWHILSCQNSDGRQDGYITTTLRLELCPIIYDEVQAWSGPHKIHVQRAHKLLCEHSCLKQFHQLFCAEGICWGKFSVCYWQITQPFIECIQRLFTDLPVKKRLNALQELKLQGIKIHDVYDFSRDSLAECFASDLSIFCALNQKSA